MTAYKEQPAKPGRVRAGVKGAATSNGTWGAVLVSLTVSILHLFNVTISADVGAQLIVVANAGAVLVGMILRAVRHNGSEL